MEELAHERKINEYRATLEKLKQQDGESSLLTREEREQLEQRLESFKKKIYSQLSAWERISICRHPQRPHGTDYIHNVFDSFTELCGDRCFADDRSVIGGFARIGEQKFVVIAQEKGHDTESRVEHNFGMPHPEGYRKALRLMRLAEKFQLPVVTLLDTPGAYPGLGAEERGQGWAIAYNLREMARLETPILVVIVGEGCSGGALGMGVGDAIGMLEHAYYSVISPEGCASILWKDAAKNTLAAETLKLNAENLQEFSLIDTIISEPLGGAHHDPEATYAAVRKFVMDEFNTLQALSLPDLLEKRYQKFRVMGAYHVNESLEEESPLPSILETPPLPV